MTVHKSRNAHKIDFARIFFFIFAIARLPACKLNLATPNYLSCDLKFYKSFETERLLLRPTGIQDATFIFRLMNSPGWLQFIGDRQIDNELKASEYIRERMLPQLERLGYGNYTVIRKSDQELLGSCGLYDREGLQGIDIGFAFLPEYAGQGYAYESVSRLLSAGVREFGLLEIKAITNKDNLASQKLLRKLGMHQNGTVQLAENSEELLLFIFK